MPSPRCRALPWVLLAGVAAAACGGGAEVDVEALPVAERAAATADPALAGSAITAFGNDLFAATRDLPGSEGQNVVVSPASVAIALAMLEPGAVDAGRDELRALLRIDDPDAFHRSMNALEQELEARVPGPANDGEDPGELVLRIANAAYLQVGYPFEQAYLDAVGAAYGPTLRAVDFAPDPDAVAHEINRFVAGETNDRIPELVGDDVLTADTVLAVVNALYLNASWLAPFDASATEDGPFTLGDGSEATVPLLHGSGDSSAAGDDWVGATKSYVGGLQIQFVLPDEGRFDEVAADLATVFAEYDALAGPRGELVVPRFESRFHVDLPDALDALGLRAVFEPGALLGIAPDPALELDQVIHETFLAIDEEGTEAAAATVVIGVGVSEPADPPVPVVLDRPFLFRILDPATGATLFVGQVLDPT